MGQDELGNGARIARQQLAVRSSGHAVVRRLNRLFGRDALLTGSRRPADADQAGDLSDLEFAVGVQQEMTEQTVGIIIVAAVFPEGKRSLQHAALLCRQPLFGNLRLGKPLCKSAVRDSHEESSLTSC
jgi:hypothetical protein